MPLKPSIQEAEAEASLYVSGQPGLHRELQEIQGYTEKPCFELPPPKKFISWHPVTHSPISRKTICYPVTI